MAEHADELRFRGHQREQATGDEDRATGQRERIGCRIVDDRERPGQLWALTLRRELLAERGDVGLKFRVVTQAVLLGRLLRGLLAHLDLETRASSFLPETGLVAQCVSAVTESSAKNARAERFRT